MHGSCGFSVLFLINVGQTRAVSEKLHPYFLTKIDNPLIHLRALSKTRQGRSKVARKQEKKRSKHQNYLAACYVFSI